MTEKTNLFPFPEHLTRAASANIELPTGLDETYRAEWQRLCAAAGLSEDDSGRLAILETALLALQTANQMASAINSDGSVNAGRFAGLKPQQILVEERLRRQQYLSALNQLGLNTPEGRPRKPGAPIGNRRAARS